LLRRHKIAAVLALLAMLMWMVPGTAAASPHWEQSVPGTYSHTVPSGVVSLTVAMYGGGGGGGGGHRTYQNTPEDPYSEGAGPGGTGGTGGYRVVTVPVQAGDVVEVRVGAGGAGGLGNSNQLTPPHSHTAGTPAQDGETGESSWINVNEGSAIEAVGGEGGRGGTHDVAGEDGEDGDGSFEGQCYGLSGDGGVTTWSSAWTSGPAHRRGQDGAPGYVSIVYNYRTYTPSSDPSGVIMRVVI